MHLWRDSSSGTGGKSERGFRRQQWGLTRLLVVCAVMVSGLVLGPVSTASASECTWYQPICGKVENHSSFGLYTTVNLNGSGNSSSCRVWNKDGGSTGNEVTWSCSPKYLAPGSSRGGNFSGTDVDAFTFTDRPYYVAYQGGPTLLVQAGFWTRFHDYETATCEPYVSSAARCIVWFTG